MTRRKHAFIVFAAIWVVLCAGTLAIHSWGGSSPPDEPSTEAESYSKFLREVTRTRLDGIERRTPEKLVEIAGEAHHALDDSLREQIREKNDTLYDCLSEAVSGSTVTTNYWEISFRTREIQDPIRLQSQLSETNARELTDVIIERATISFKASEQACVARALQGLRVEAENVGNERLAYVMCVNRRPDT